MHILFSGVCGSTCNLLLHKLFNTNEIDKNTLDTINYASIKVLRDTLKRYAGKIRREDEHNNILFDLDRFFDHQNTVVLFHL